jgi:hypothetical protein
VGEGRKTAKWTTRYGMQEGEGEVEVEVETVVERMGLADTKETRKGGEASECGGRK